MYEYQYINVDTGGGLLFGNRHRKIIDREAAQGWRYVGYVPTKFDETGGTKEIDLIFERPKK